MAHIPLQELSRDRALACDVFFAHRHKDATPPFHVEMLDLWGCADEFVVLEAFREAAKSTRAEEFLLLEACFRNFNYAILIGETYTKACQRLDAVKHEALSNTKLQAYFGKLKGEIWTENRASFPNGVLIEAFGWEQEIRGFLHRGNRPDRLHIDDAENKTRVKDERAVDESMRKLYQEVIPAMDKRTRRVRATGTELAGDCMLSRLAADPDWVARKFPLCDRDPYDPLAASLWPARYPIDWCRKEKRMYEAAGRLADFNQEYMLQPPGQAQSGFGEDMLRFEESAPLEWAPKHLIVDPSRTAGEASSRVGRVIISRAGSTIYVHKSRGEYLKPDAIIDSLFEDHRQHRLATVSIEKDSLDEWLMQPIRTRMLASGVSLPLKPLNAPRDQDKIAFIKGLQPFFNAGDIVLLGPRASHSQLVAEILNYPAGKLDVLNALAYSQRVFARAPVYADFGHANVVSELDPASEQTPLVLAFQEDVSGVAAVLVAVEGIRLCVLASWSAAAHAQDVVASVMALARSAYPRNRLSSVAPGDVFDQHERATLLSALQRAKLSPHRGYYAKASRGSLASMIRTRSNDKPLLLVDSRATDVANALAYGYGHVLRKDGSPEPEPERNAARTLIEALECLTFAHAVQHNALDLPEGALTATTPGGQRYITSRPGKGAVR
jgi:hypothetical protein